MRLHQWKVLIKACCNYLSFDGLPYCGHQLLAVVFAQDGQHLERNVKKLREEGEIMKKSNLNIVEPSPAAPHTLLCRGKSLTPACQNLDLAWEWKGDENFSLYNLWLTWVTSYWPAFSGRWGILCCLISGLWWCTRHRTWIDLIRLGRTLGSPTYGGILWWSWLRWACPSRWGRSTRTGGIWERLQSLWCLLSPPVASWSKGFNVVSRDIKGKVLIWPASSQSQTQIASFCKFFFHECTCAARRGRGPMTFLQVQSSWISA